MLLRISLRGIARILKVSLEWVVKRAKQLWQAVPKELPLDELTNPELCLYCLESVVIHRDEMWAAFVVAKDCPEWLWLAVEG